MKSLFTIALLSIVSIASAQPGRHREEGRFQHKNHNKHEKLHKKDYKKGKKHAKQHHKHDYNYRVERELSRYDFLRLNRNQRARLQFSLNYMISNNYAQREYERRLRADLSNILSREQYRSWENRAYTNNGNVFVFNFNI
nr:hypothetical protein [uncultured Flavobacterium sp.]